MLSTPLIVRDGVATYARSVLVRAYVGWRIELLRNGLFGNWHATQEKPVIVVPLPRVTDEDGNKHRTTPPPQRWRLMRNLDLVNQPCVLGCLILTVERLVIFEALSYITSLTRLDAAFDNPVRPTRSQPLRANTHLLSAPTTQA